MNQTNSLTFSPSLKTDDLVDKPPCLVVTIDTKTGKSSSCPAVQTRCFSNMPARGPLNKFSLVESDSTALTAASDISSCLVDDEEEQSVHNILSPSANKSVTFAPRATVKSTISRHEITPEEKQAAWFSKNEYSLISVQCSKQILRMERGEVLKDVKYCSRGLESYTRRASQLKHQNRQAAYMAVFDEEDDGGYFHHHQEDENEHIAKKYYNVSSSCQLWASVQGLRDQRAAEAYLLDITEF